MKNAMIALYQSRNRQISIGKAQEKLLEEIKIWVEENPNFDINAQTELLKIVVSEAIEAHQALDSQINSSQQTLFQLKTNKMCLILKNTIELISQDNLAYIFNGKFPKDIDPNIQEWTSVPSNPVGDDQFFGTVKVDTLSTLLLCIVYCLNKQKEDILLKEYFEEMIESALCHSISLKPIIELNPIKFLSPFIRIDEEGRQNLLVINGGYAFGGMREERIDWCYDPLLGPEDCSSFAAKAHGSQCLYNTIDQYAFFQSKSGNSASVVREWEASPEGLEMSKNLEIVPDNNIQLGDICMKRMGISNDKILGTSGHTGIVLQSTQSNAVALVHARRNIEEWRLDGMGIGKITIENTTDTRFAFFRPMETQETLSRAGLGTPFFGQKRSDFKEEPKDYEVLCQSLDAKYFNV